MSSTKPGGPIRPELADNDPNRPKISLPVELLHTTNMLSYNAPDLPRPSTSTSSQASTNTDNDYDSAPGTALSSPPTSPDVSPSELKGPPSPNPNHLSSYFGAPRQAPQAPTTTQASVAAPAIPQRAPSRSKQASEDAIARQRSTGRLQKKNPSMSRSNGSVSTAHSATPSVMSHRSGQSQSSMGSSVSAPAPPVPAVPQAKPQPTPQPPSQHPSQYPSQHPFGAELAQVNEMAEEFGVSDRKDDIHDEEERELINRGFCKFSADVYLHDVEVLMAMFFHNKDIRQSRPAPAKDVRQSRPAPAKDIRQSRPALAQSQPAPALWI